MSPEAAARRPWLEHAHDWVVTVDHKRLGIMYVVSGLVFFVVAGIEATLMRLQLAWPGLHIVPPETFNRLFTMHGTSMVFLVGIPIVFGFGNYLVPLMIGARDLAFPRLNAFGFWVFLFGGILLHFSVIGGDGLYGAGSAPAVGWFAYAPLTGRAFTPGNATDYWNLAVLVTGFGTSPHHMFAVGLGGPLNTYFALSTMVVHVPTGIKLFNWLGTMYGGKLDFKTPVLFCGAFHFQFLSAGLTGVMLSVAPFNWQL